MAALGYLPKLKRGLGPAFGAHFLHHFFHENVLYLIIYPRAKFQYHTFFSSKDIKQNVLRFIFDHPLKQRPTGRKKGED